MTLARRVHKHSVMHQNVGIKRCMTLCLYTLRATSYEL